MRFLADMNISPLTVAVLNEKGWQITRVSTVLPARTTDRDILEYAKQNDYVVVTQDLDFSTLLVLSRQNRPSLITLRLSLSDPDTVTHRLLRILPFVQTALETGSAVTVEDRTVRVRSLVHGIDSHSSE